MTTETKPMRKSVPTADMQRWWNVGWAYVMPDFDKPNHSIIEWLSTSAPADPDAEQLAAAVGELSDELARVG